MSDNIIKDAVSICVVPPFIFFFVATVPPFCDWLSNCLAFVGLSVLFLIYIWVFSRDLGMAHTAVFLAVGIFAWLLIPNLGAAFVGPFCAGLVGLLYLSTFAAIAYDSFW